MLRLGLIAPPWTAVPPHGYGGTEAVVDVLARGLAARGHDVRLFATGDSTCPVPTGWVFDRPPEPVNDLYGELRHVQAAYQHLADRDLIHDHSTLGPVWAGAVRPAAPVVATCHGVFDQGRQPVYAAVARWAAVTAISHRQRQTAPDVPVAAVIHHGLDVERFPVGAGDGGYLAFVGRMAPEKGVLEAVRIAAAAGLPLRVATKMRSAEEVAYFHEQVEPLAGPDVTFLGEIDAPERDALVGGALALLNPIAWEEPFGLVMVEALACGTPVVAFPRGAAPEIVEDGVTGFLVADPAAAVRAVSRVGDLDRAACRRSVVERFSAQRMVTDYERVYAAVLSASGGRR